MTVNEYLEFEKSSEIRHEFVNGELYAMTGETLETRSAVS
jgi:Uma2 family endonuclease